MEDKDILDYRNKLMDIEQRIAEQFDKTILTIASGALAISLAFIKNVIVNGSMQKGWLLVISWACLTACLIFILISFYFGLLAYRKAQEQVDNQTIKNETPGGYYSNILKTCNMLGIILLCVGLITLLTFAYYNLSKEIINGKKTCTETCTKETHTKATSSTTRRRSIFPCTTSKAPKVTP